MRKLKKVTALLLILIHAFVLADTVALAVPPGNPHIESGTAADGGNFFEFDAIYLGESGWRDLKTPPHWVVETGEVAYCLDHMGECPHNVAYGEFDPLAVYSERTYTGLLAIMEHSYPYRNAGLTDQQIKYATANAIRSWLRESAGIGYDFMLPSNHAVRPKGSAGQGPYNFYLQLLDKARNGSVANHSVKTNPEVIEMHMEGDVLVGQAIIECGVLNGGYEINEGVLPEGVSITGYTGGNGDVLTITVPIDLMGENINITDVFTGYDNRCAANVYWLDDSGGSQSVAVPVVDRMVSVAIGSLSFKSDASTVTITKHSKTDGILLKGAVFGIYDASNDSLVEQLTTESSGQAVSNNLLIGDYYIKEITAPEGYVLSLETYPFSITDTNQNIEISVYNDPIKGKASILKTGEQDNSLQDVLFCIYDSGENLIQEIITDDQGRAVSNYLAYGDYYLKEASAPEGYILNDEKIPFSIINDEETVEVTISNILIRGKVKVIKKDEEGNPLEGVVFSIYDTDDKLIEEISTNAEGIAISPDMIYGEYHLIETEALEGYGLNDEAIAFRIYENDETVEFEIINEKIYGYVEVIKKDSDIGVLLEGAVFELYDSLDNPVETLSTDSNGYAISSALEFGDYYIKEIEAPGGYVLADKTHSFSIANNEETITLDITNDPIKGKVEILKTDSDTRKVLSGAVFGIYDENDKLMYELETDGNGSVISPTLLYGNYYVKEITAPEGYILNEDVYSFSIIDNNQIVHFDIENEIIRGKAIIRKTEPIAGDTLKGVKFCIYDIDNNLIEETITDENGIALSSDLIYGEYFIQEMETFAVYIPDDNKYQIFICEDGQTVEFNIKNTPVSGNVEVFFRHIDYGNELYDSYVYNDWIGMPYMDWFESKGLINKDIEGYTLEKSDYPTSNVLIDGKLTITYWYDDEISEGSWSEVAIPKTGQEYPMESYLAGILCFIIALFIMGVSYNSIKSGKKK